MPASSVSLATKASFSTEAGRRILELGGGADWFMVWGVLCLVICPGQKKTSLAGGAEVHHSGVDGQGAEKTFRLGRNADTCSRLQ
ncbi:MAG: hypothetical protein Tsb0019_23110 [Roseibium sp.]